MNIRKTIAAALTVFTLALIAPLALAPSSAYAASASDCPTAEQNSPKNQVLKGISKTGNKCSTGGVSDTVAAAVQILGFVAGIAAIIMIIVSGFKYITSSGDAAKVSSAKTSLVYALIGLAIAALAQVLVRFVLSQATQAVK